MTRKSFDGAEVGFAIVLIISTRSAALVRNTMGSREAGILEAHTAEAQALKERTNEAHAISGNDARLWSAICAPASRSAWEFLAWQRGLASAPLALALGLQTTTALA